MNARGLMKVRMMVAVLVLVASCGATGQAPSGTDHADAGDGPSAPPAPPAVSGSLFLTIDDMEDTAGLTEGGFWGPFGIGNWFYGSASAALPFWRGDTHADTIVPARGDSKNARHLRGDGAPDGAEVWAQLRHPLNDAVDLRPYAGIAFWARLASPSGRLIVAVRGKASPVFMVAESTTPLFAQSLAASDQWQRFILLFDDFRQGVTGGTGSGAAIKVDAISSIDFVFGFDNEPFDLWIDDLMLLCRGVCPARQ